MKISTCRYCPARVVWLLTKNDKVMPINLAFMESLVGDVETALPERYSAERHQAGVHWQNCPGADKARRRR